MRVRLRNYGYYADLLGGPVVELEMPGPTLGDLFAAVKARFGVDLEARPNLRLILGDRVLHSFPASLTLEEGVEVALVPVVAGGGRGELLVREGVNRGAEKRQVFRERAIIHHAGGEERRCTGGHLSPGWCCSCWPPWWRPARSRPSSPSRPSRPSRRSSPRRSTWDSSTWVR